MKHFTDIFNEPNVDKSLMDGVVFLNLLYDVNLALSIPFTL